MDTLSQKKTIILLSVVFLVVAVAGVTAVALLSRRPATESPPPEAPGLPTASPRTDGAAPPAASSGGPTAPVLTAKLTEASNTAVESATLNKEENSILYYQKDDGNVFAVTFPAGGQEKISNTTVLGLIEAVWSPKKDRAAVFYLDKEVLKGLVQIISTSTITTLPTNIKSFSWSPTGDAMAYLIEKGEELQLITADRFGKKPITVFRTQLKDLRLDWITTDKIALQTLPSGLASGYIFTFNKKTGEFKKIIGPLPGLSSLWSPKGDRVLVSYTNQHGKAPVLRVYDSNGEETYKLDPKTLVQKCAWASDTNKLLCGVPKNAPSSSLWPDNYLRGELNTADIIASIDLERQEVKEVFGERLFDVSNLVLTHDQSHLFFIDRNTGRLWRLDL